VLRALVVEPCAAIPIVAIDAIPAAVISIDSFAVGIVAFPFASLSVNLTNAAAESVVAATLEAVGNTELYAVIVPDTGAPAVVTVRVAVGNPAEYEFAFAQIKMV